MRVTRMGVALALMAPLVAAGSASAAAEGAAPAARPGESLAAQGAVAPLDVLHAEDLARTGFTSLPRALAALVPTLVFPQPALAGGTDHARPLAMRGLAPDQVLVLLNGKRRHDAAWLHRDDTYGRGSASGDLSVIPLSAVERVEILRDSAAARYGSGALAGVINVVLKDAPEGAEFSATFGHYRTHFEGVPDLGGFAAVSPSEFRLFEGGDLNTDDGEGDTLTLAAHGGFTLFDRGYLTLSALYRDQEPTNRAGHDPRHIYPLLADGRFDPREEFFDRRNHRLGNPDQQDLDLLAAFGSPVSDAAELYGFIGYSARNAESAGLYRRALDLDNVPAIFPHGYLPLIESDGEDRYFTLGVRGSHWGWDWDVSYTQGENETDWTLRNSVNPSLGSISPSRFAVANFEGRHTIGSLEVRRSVDLGLPAPLQVEAGVEARDAEYENEAGDTAAVVAAGARDADGRLRPPGAQGFDAVRREDDFDDNVTNFAGWLELSTRLRPGLQTLVGLRVDEQDPNTDVSARIAASWQLLPRLSLRGTLSRDFRAPSAAQTHFVGSRLVVADDGYAEVGVYPAAHRVAQALGAEALDSETSWNLSGGFRLQATDDLTLAANVYQIDIDDRIVLSDLLRGPVVEDLLDAAGAGDVVAARYLFNGVDTRTRGLDVSADYRWHGGWGEVLLSAGLNLNDTDVTGSAAVSPVLRGVGSGDPRLGREQRAQLATWMPDSKLHLSARWEGQRLGVTARVLRYGEVTDLAAETARDHELDPEWLLDLHARYRLRDGVFLSGGVHNLLDAYSTALPREADDPVQNRFVPYSNFAPFGYNGRFVYLRLGLTLQDEG